MEKQIMQINLIGVGVAVSTWLNFSGYNMDNLALAIISIVVNQIFRCVYAEKCWQIVLRLCNSDMLHDSYNNIYSRKLVC